jgi:ParB family chromosome partitioning protein
MHMGKRYSLVSEIPVSSISEPKCPIRSDVSRKELSSLAQSIMDKGLLEPIVVRRTSKGYEVVAGSRRLKAFRYLNLEKIPCHIVKANDKEAYEISIIENVQHQTLNPIDEALAYKRYIEEFGYGGVSALASKIGKSQEYVSLRLALLKLPSEILDKLIRRQISPTTAQELLPLSPAQQKRLAALAVEGNLTKRQIRREVKLLQQEEFEGLDWIKKYDSNDETNRGSKKHDDDYYINKSMRVLKSSLLALGDIIESLHESSPLREILFEYRFMIHNQINSLIKLKKKWKSMVAIINNNVLPKKTYEQNQLKEIESLALP